MTSDVSSLGIDRRVRSRAACLTIPGSVARMLVKAQALLADQVVLDLEDSVPPDDKDAARHLVIEALCDGDWQAETRSVRVNACRSPWILRDVVALVEGAGQQLHTVLLPKAGSAACVSFVDLLVDQLERQEGLPHGTIGIELQIEDAPGLVALPDMLAASPRIEAVVLGPGDLAAALGLPSTTVGAIDPTYPGDNWHWIRAQVLVHARAAGVQAIDGPYARIRDPEGLIRSAEIARSMGFDGKWVIHPGQIDTVREVFGVEVGTFERAQDLVDAYEHAVTVQGRGAAVFAGEMIDEATRRMASSIVARGRAMGLTVRQVPADIPFDERARWRDDHLA